VNGELSGNAVDFEMFHAVGWKARTDDKSTLYLEPPTLMSLTSFARVIRCFEFDHSKKSMSVVIQDSFEKFHMFTKGSFEEIKHMSLEESVPQHADEVVETLARKGLYVLGLAHTYVVAKSIAQIMAMKRDELERNATFLGLVSFRLFTAKQGLVLLGVDLL
jgi:cation-transporting ATPase 13A3/4/5